MKRAAALALALLVSGAWAGNHGSESGSEHAANYVKHDVPMLPRNNLAQLSGHQFDLEFTGQMIAHHQMAVAMARYELQKGRETRVLNEARQVIVTQQRELARMQNWSKSWGVKLIGFGAVDMNMPMHGQVDRWFLEGMIPHHQGAIDMARLVPERTQNTQLRKMAQDIIRVQSAEITHYRKLLKTVK